MDNTNSKILTLSFGIAAALIGFTLHLLIKIFSVFRVGRRRHKLRPSKTRNSSGGWIRIIFIIPIHPKIRAWGEEVISEVRKVIFPSSKDTTLMTVSVVIMVFISSAIVWSFDMFSAYVVKLLMR